jgi:deoxyribodipyrimidine photo-lyase
MPFSINPHPTKAPAILWLRLDLRLADNAALRAALNEGGPVIPVFIHAPEEESPWQPGAASSWWLHQSLARFDERCRARGSRLILRAGPTLESLRRLAKETGARAVFWNRRYEPAILSRDARVREMLIQGGLTAESHNAALLHEPWTVQNKSGKPFQVFTPFWKHCLGKTDPGEPLPAPRNMPAPARWPKSLDLAELGLEPKHQWASGLREAWQPGEDGALNALDQFSAAAFDNYTEGRNRPDAKGTSRLSPHLHFGEIGPRQIWSRLRKRAEKSGQGMAGWRGLQFLAELGWREFAHHLLFHFPESAHQPLRTEFKSFTWRQNSKWLGAWQQGRTGYPMVDAGMRELWSTGWMHNRVRMIAGSFLVKDLLISWREGARWFWDTLVDADLAQNTLGWQWTAGCGADAAPFFRVFNPATQGMKFDPNGDYVRRWIPELANLPAAWIHQPQAAPVEILRKAGVELGRTYPHPIISHAIAREVALEAFAKFRGKQK